MLGLLLAFAGLLILQAALATGSAFADATVGPAPTPGPTGLPDARIYEQVSPANKHGAEAQIGSPAFVTPDGEAVMYSGNGAIAEDSSNATWDPTVVSERTSHGWVTRSSLPLPAPGRKSEEENVRAGTITTLMVPSSNLQRLLFGTWLGEAYVGPPDETELGNNIYLAGANPLAEPEWVGRSQIPGKPGGIGGGKGVELFVAGASPSLETVYFYYRGELLPGASSLYEYRDGVLSDAGVLPGGETGSGKATPAAQQLPTCAGCNLTHRNSSDAYDNQVSEDGSRIFFVRDDAAGTLELYVHITEADGAQRTQLVSQSQMSGSLGAPAPSGPLEMESTAQQPFNPFDPETRGQPNPPSYVFASPDGTHAFFQSVSQLTADAPANGSAKTYDFDVETGQLEYVPGIAGSIVTVSTTGSTLVFENTTTSPAQLEWWSAGSGTTPIVQLPEAVSPEHACEHIVCIAQASLSAAGNVVAFVTESPIPGFNDEGSHYERRERYLGEVPKTEYGPWPNTEVFRYDAEARELSCLSCPGQGVTPSSNAVLSRNTTVSNSRGTTGWAEVTDPGRSMTANGESVFFETRDSLVPQDTNGAVDVYEWHAGALSLISSGHSTQSSGLIGTSESGNDVFFLTAEGILPGDTDGSYDVYDARVPRPGDNPPPAAVPCTGSVCQGPPSVPQLLGPPASETFNGVGNLTSTPEKSVVVSKRKLARSQKLKRAIKQCRRKRRASRRKACTRKARGRYKARASRRGGDRRRGK